MKNPDFCWRNYPRAEQWLLAVVDGLKAKQADLLAFEERLVLQTSTRLFEWLDHILLAESAGLGKELLANGFLPEERTGRPVYSVPGALLPKVVLAGRQEVEAGGLALRVESLDDFLLVNGFTAAIEGQPLGPYRTCRISRRNGVSFLAVERRAPDIFEPVVSEPYGARHYLEARELWQGLARAAEDQADEDRLFAVLTTAVARIVSLVGENLAAHLVCQCERDYWMSRNHAARLQKARQDGLGLGWANHDHHTFRSSRPNFARLIRLFQTLGFQERERFYAGREAGWGAQVMEHPAGLVLFLDVDLDEDEVAIDYLRQELPPRDALGTVGLWCALHGDSILKAGLHHLAVRALFSKLRQDLREGGISFMAPFTDLDHLKQAFSKGEIWSVEPDRLARLVREKRLPSSRARQFVREGAVGSHLENIQRRQGFKGFNQATVSNIIRRLDPRKVKGS